MELYSNGLMWEDSTLVVSSIVDELSGHPLRKTPSSPGSSGSSSSDGRLTLDVSPHQLAQEQKKARRLHHFITFLCSLAVIFVSAVTYRLGRGAGQREGLIGGTTSIGTTHTKDRAVARRKKLLSLVLDWGVTKRDIIGDDASAPGRAFQWLVYNDSHSVNAETIRTRYALATLYFSTQSNSTNDDPTWIVASHWLSSYPVCMWHGVECADHDDTVELVRALNLSSNGLVGTIPDELSLLELDIRSLDVSFNNVTGSVPNSLFSLKNLVDLYLGPNSFSSTTIPDTIKELRQLKNLYMNDCGLEGEIPSGIGNLSHLRTFVGYHESRTRDIFF